MEQKIREDVLRRLLVSKHFLASASGQLTPNADAVAVAKMILTAHDAAELAAAAIADQLGVPGLSGQLYLMDYPHKIKSHVPDKGELPGTGFLKQLNSIRKAFKHEGILPNPRDWYRVIERTWDYVDSWCRVYLGQPLDEIDLEELLKDSEVRGLHQRAKSLHADGRYREALEYLGIAFYRVLDAFPGILSPVLGKRHPDDALMLATFGVRASDFLSLQEFLPEVSQDRKTGELRVSWNTRESGHQGNWSHRSVSFCLDAFIDIALKIQHAPWHPRPVPFFSVFDDVIRARSDGVEVLQEKSERPFDLTGPREKTVVRRLQKGDTIRGVVFPVDRRPTDPGSLADILGPKATVETADLLAVLSEDISGGPLYVKREDVEVAYAPKENEYVRKYFPHLFAAKQE